MIAKVEMYYRSIVDCWRLFKKYRVPQQSEAFWQELHDDAHRIFRDNQNTVFVKHLLFVMMDEIDRIWEEIKT
jgi:hypothetical protein